MPALFSFSNQAKQIEVQRFMRRVTDTTSPKISNHRLSRWYEEGP